MDLMLESYGYAPNSTSHEVAGVAQPSKHEDEMVFGGSRFVSWVVVVFFTLMRRNVSREKMRPYVQSLLRALRNNWEEFVHGQPIFDVVPVYNVSLGSWATRAKALLNILVLDALGFAFLASQGIAALGQALLLSVGSVWISLAIAAHAKGLEKCVRHSNAAVMIDGSRNKKKS